MERRELLKMIALLTGGVMIGSNALLTGCSPDKGNFKKNAVFTQQDQDFLDEVSDTILPATQTPGAKAAKVGAFMTVMVNDCYEEKDQKVFKEGIAKLNAACEKMYGCEFMKATVVQRLALLVKLDEEAKAYQAKRGDLPAHYFTMMKQLTLLGYFSSEPGCTKAMRYIAVPGHYKGSVPYKKGDKAWA
ncbi:gluconate 2-dehydrogenase subunit 3 family protein [Pedobacter cryoconitis]|uniref:Gluconate 2-dehydrogenase subunit 3-like protein n=1 Tax=Pedobacter cryoconitis TaxID=188932 RepID=A0A327SDW7_9SPHI|nr:gluconate 2-dehydrogenase subunit 3 family protein [Pedobacter cryoconitis]RAJ27266.1 gluconate 2-dehydrogenase subunit 3-like protein [Pedobacter cryoconitis]